MISSATLASRCPSRACLPPLGRAQPPVPRRHSSHHVAVGAALAPSCCSRSTEPSRPRASRVPTHSSPGMVPLRPLRRHPLHPLRHSESCCGAGYRRWGHKTGGGGGGPPPTAHWGLGWGQKGGKGGGKRAGENQTHLTNKITWT